MKLPWKTHQKLLFFLALVLFLGTVLTLVILWDTIPERLTSNIHVLGKTLSDTSRKSFTLIPMLLIEGFIFVLISLISCFPDAWNCKTEQYPSRSIPKLYSLTRTTLLASLLWLVGLFSAITLDQAFNLGLTESLYLIIFGLSFAAILGGHFFTRRHLKGERHG